jgi:hypothetical protein
MELKELHAEIGKKFIQREQLVASLNQLNQEIQTLFGQIQEAEKAGSII